MSETVTPDGQIRTVATCVTPRVTAVIIDNKAVIVTVTCVTPDGRI